MAFRLYYSSRPVATLLLLRRGGHLLAVLTLFELLFSEGRKELQSPNTISMAKAETRNTRPPVSLLLCDNLKNRMFLQNFFS
jgi:hypothetical protein